MQVISRGFVYIDRAADYIPIVSTITNLYAIFLKCIILPLMKETFIQKNHYFKYMQQKDLGRCFLLLIPLYGNICAGIPDIKWNFKVFALPAVKRNGFGLRNANERLRDDKDMVLAAVQNTRSAIEYASERLKADRDVFLAAHQSLENAYVSLRDDRDVVLTRVREDGEEYKYASERLRQDREVKLAALYKIYPDIERKIQRDLQRNLDPINPIIDRFIFQPDQGCSRQFWNLGREIANELREIRQRQRLMQRVGVLHVDDKKYQDDLGALIKKTFIELHDNENLVRMLSREGDVEDGRLELTTFSTTIQLANYIQLQEIQADIICPAEFKTNDLMDYNGRGDRLSDAKIRVGQLNDRENQMLIEMLLKTADFDINAQGLAEDRKIFLQQLFNDIGNLAGKLHQGKLLTQKFVDVGQLNRGNFHGAYAAHNLFNGACQDAVKEIEARVILI